MEIGLPSAAARAASEVNSALYSTPAIFVSNFTVESFQVKSYSARRRSSKDPLSFTATTPILVPSAVENGTNVPSGTCASEGP